MKKKAFAILTLCISLFAAVALVRAFYHYMTDWSVK